MRNHHWAIVAAVGYVASALTASSALAETAGPIITLLGQSSSTIVGSAVQTVALHRSEGARNGQRQTAQSAAITKGSSLGTPSPEITEITERSRFMGITFNPQALVNAAKQKATSLADIKALHEESSYATTRVDLFPPSMRRPDRFPPDPPSTRTAHSEATSSTLLQSGSSENRA